MNLICEHGIYLNENLKTKAEALKKTFGNCSKGRHCTRFKDFIRCFYRKGKNFIYWYDGWFFDSSC